MNKYISYLTKQAFENSPGNTYFIDKNCIYYGCNHNVALILGLSSPSDIVGKKLIDLLPKSNRAMALKVMEGDKKIMREKVEKTFEEEGVNEKGETVIYLTKKKPIFFKGKVIGMVGTSIDISSTELDRALKIINLAPGNIYWTDENAKYLGCNFNNAQLLNLKKSEDIVGKTALDFKHIISQETAVKIHKSNLDVIKNGKETVFEEKATLPDGSSITYLTKKIPIFDSKKHVKGIIGTSIDISESSNTYKILAHTIAHEARTPLSAAVMAAETLDLALEQKDPFIQKQIDKIRMLCLNTSKFIDMHADIHKLEKINVESFKKISINNIIESSVENFPYNTNEKKLINYKLLSTQAFIYGDIQLITHAIWNIIKNSIYAIKLSGNGTLKIYPKLNKKTIDIVFHDNAGGIPDDILKNIFKPFFTKKSSGTGIGLYFCKQAVEKHGGKLTCKSKARDTLFTIQLPITDK